MEVAAYALAAASISASILRRKSAKKEDQKKDTEFKRVPLDELPKLKNDLLIRTARNLKTERAPVWVMRQAGRYLPEFREVRKSYDFFSMCQTPEVACEITLQPLRRFQWLDAVIIFCDILIVPQAMGMEVLMIPGKGPTFPKPLVEPRDVRTLNLKPNLEETVGYLFNAINLTRQRVEGKVPVIGFCGGPWTLMAYMVEGGGSKTFHKAKTWLYEHPSETHDLLSAIGDILVDLLVKQYEAGAQLLQVFESWAGELSPDLFQEFSKPYLARIAKKVRERVPPVSEGGPPMTVFAKGAAYALDDLAETEYDVIGLDWTVDPAEAAKIVRGRKVLQGNLDPCALYGSPSVIRSRVQHMVQRYGRHRFIANLGHGMHPTHQPAHLGAFMEAVHDFSVKEEETEADKEWGKANGWAY